MDKYMIKKITDIKELSDTLKKIKRTHGTFILIGFPWLTFGTLVKHRIVTVFNSDHINLTFNNSFGDSEIHVQVKQDKFYISDSARVYYINYNDKARIEDTISKLDRLEKMPSGLKFLDRVTSSDVPIRRLEKDGPEYGIRDFEEDQLS